MQNTQERLSQPQRDLHRHVRYFVRLSRVRGWWDNLLHLTGTAYLLWDYLDQASIGAGGFAAYMGFVLCLLTGAYALNDVCDFSKDSVLYRDGRNQPHRKHSLIYALTMLVMGMILLPVATRKTLALGIGVVTLLMGIAYSLPPMRLKERGGWGVTGGAAAQRPVHFLVFAAILGAWNWFTIVLTAWLFFGSLLSMLGHQILDYNNDLAAGVRTFTADHGIQLSLRLCMVCAAGIGMMVLAPVAFAPITEAIPVVGLLAALSLVYAGKGVHAMRIIRAA
ncbi:UbiA family prenyltransferase [Candidatus Latescibacterota bacterium]